MISKNDMKISKFISLVLRHKPQVIGATLESDGYLDVAILIDGINKKLNIKTTMIDIERIVSEDDKQRYSFNEDKSKIRANQGHSINVDLELKETIPPDILYHGTYTKVLESILQQGIKKMNREYVHLSHDLNTASKVGSRHGELIVLTIDTKRMYDDGYKFYLSKNKVWLTEFVPNKYIQLIEDGK